MNKKLLITVLSLVIAIMSGCTWVNEQTKQNPPSNKNMICAQLKQKMLFIQNNPGANDNWNSYNRQNRLLNEYKKFNCDQLEEATSK